MNNLETKEFTLLTPFSIVTKDVSVTDHTNDKVIRITGCANFAGKDEFGKTFVDLAGDCIDPSGVDTSAWEVNPQILYQHDRDYTIGRGLTIDKRPEGIWITAEIHADAMTPQDFYRIKSGLVCMFSVGFRTKSSDWVVVDEKEVYLIKECLLLEVSCVSIPCNLKSQFEVVKALPEGAVTSEIKRKETITETKEETAMANIKVKRADLLSSAELKQFKSLGGNDQEELEMDISGFVKTLVAREVEAILAAKEKAAEEAAKAAEEEAATKAAEEAAKQEEEKAAAEEAAKEEEEKNLADEFSGLKELVETLKAAIAEEK